MDVRVGPKKAELLRMEVPLDCKEIQPAILRSIPSVHWADVEAESILWPTDGEAD